MPIGWQTCFGMQMAKELKQALIEADYLDTYEILQVKEKYGQLRWYDAGAPKKANDIINKYCFISEHVCIQCGSTHATQMDLWGWISPICEDCFNRMKKSRAAEGYGKDIEWPVENAPYEIPDYYTEQRRSSDGSFETYQIDITETKQMLNKRYEKRRKNWKKGKIRSATKMAAKSQVKENTCE
jgi:hypothetical protein